MRQRRVGSSARHREQERKCGPNTAMIFYVPEDCVLNYDFVLHTGQQEYFGYLIFGIFQVINSWRAVFFENILWGNFAGILFACKSV